jgi:DNA-directed RNA polymerase beta' subunit
MARLLSQKEINDLVSFIKPQQKIPFKTAMSVVKLHKKLLIDQLKPLLIDPKILDKLSYELQKAYFSSLIQPGEAVGVIAAQSIGERNTQTTLNTFHVAGQSNCAVTEGVPRFQELLNATKNPKLSNHKIFFKYGNESIAHLRETINRSILGINFIDIILTSEITTSIEVLSSYWFSAFCVLDTQWIGGSIKEFISLGQTADFCLKLQMNVKSMFLNKISEPFIVQLVHSNFSDLQCVFSPFNDGIIYILVSVEVLSKLPVNSETNDVSNTFLNSTNAIQIYLEEVVLREVEKIKIAGINGISEVFFIKESTSVPSWYLQTNVKLSSISRKCSSSQKNILQLILGLESVDKEKTVSNNIWEIYETLGIVACKEFLIEEFMLLMDGINKAHAILLVDRMTFNGSISAISRYTLKHDESGCIGKASFEESVDNFLTAALQGEVDKTNGVSASILCGKRSQIGTGICSLKMDFKKIASNDIFDDDDSDIEPDGQIEQLASDSFGNFEVPLQKDDESIETQSSDGDSEIDSQDSYETDENSEEEYSDDFNTGLDEIEIPDDDQVDQFSSWLGNLNS